MDKQIINEYGDVINPNDPTLKKFQSIIQNNWKVEGDPYQDKDIDQIMFDYIKYFKQKSDKQFDQKQKNKNKWHSFISNIKKLFVK